MKSGRGNLYVRILFAVVTVLAVSGLIEIYGLYDQVYFNKGIISAAVFGLSFYGAEKGAKCLRTDFRTSMIAAIVAGLLFFTELIGIALRLTANDYSVILSGKSVLWMAGSALAIAFSALPFFCRILSFEAVQEAAGHVRVRGKRLRTFIVTWLVVFASYIPCFLAFYPGLYCYDMSWQWEMYAAKDYSTHHPLIHTWLSGSLFELGRQWFGTYNAGMVLYVLLQLVFLSGCIAFAMDFLKKIRIPRIIRGSILGFYMFFPFFAVLGVSTTKDVYFGGLFLLVFVCVCDMIQSGKLYRGWRLAAFSTSLVLMGLLRNNAVYGMAFMVVCVVAAILIRRIRGAKLKFLLKYAVVFIMTIVVTMGMFGVLEKGFHAQKGSIAEMLSVPCQQLARTYVFHEAEMAESDKEELFSYIPEESLNQYQYYVSDPVKAGLNANHLQENKKEFVQLWLRIGRQFPGEYILAPFYNTMGIWYLGGDSSSSVVYDMREFIDDVHVFEKNSLLPGAEQWYRWFTDTNIQKYLPVISMIFYTSFYSWAVVICTAAVVQRKKYMYLLLSLMLIGYLLTLFLGPCITVRYMMNVMLCIPVLIAVTFWKTGEDRKKHCDVE